MKKILVLLIFLFSFNLSPVKAVEKESTKFWYKGYGIAKSWSRSIKNPSYIGTNYEWAVITVHSFNDPYGNAIDRVRVFAREESPTYEYGSKADVRTLQLIAGIKDNEGTQVFKINDMLPIEKTLQTELKPIWYDLLGLIPWKGAELITTSTGFILDVLSNFFQLQLNIGTMIIRKKDKLPLHIGMI
ncbi:hypothetical protein M670_03175 [Schinkia azotoformans MEV2011]|uniref:Uncharacterized protein n=1 Tax=Schinkia azotoformans MEV2011 TaxID=1348973 RepID=A0A072NIU9_SCHAZ|nr:hypothetical protein [Schinkia azotoformans]KEF37594.1 hypothetical protein M670_03175 [Schinkia azotoformans MEV2011]MEC1695320.1 hypothetical protein [Schinkia azotoformans]MEC1724656.1 hypothetical protein [Schinkia azotoformans]MEC1771120.1 hypothetical protein [Schinkia azotoformans]MEC1777994.1 hypothetical protein [Schinkia azotoformans]